MNLSWFDDWRFDMRESTVFRENPSVAAIGAAVRPIAGKPAPTGIAHGLGAMRSRWELACRRWAAQRPQKRAGARLGDGKNSDYKDRAATCTAIAPCSGRLAPLVFTRVILVSIPNLSRGLPA